MGQDPRPARPALRVLLVPRVRRDQQRLGIAAVRGGTVLGELVAQDGLGEPVQLQAPVDAGQAIVADPPEAAVRH